MASYPPAQVDQWRTAVRFLMLGLLICGLVVALWWISRLADRIETSNQLLISIQADVKSNQGQVSAVLAAAEQISHRMVSVEERASAASDDRRQMRATDQQLTEAIIRMRALVDAIHDPEALHDLPVDEDPGPKTRPRPRLKR